MRVAELLRAARLSSGVAVRELAARAGVAGSTFTRAQSGTVFPSTDTLERMFAAAGFELTYGLVPLGTAPGPRLEDVAWAWTLRGGGLRLDWTRWRVFLDGLALHPEFVPEAIYVPPPPSGQPVVDALLAAVAEKLADDAGLPHPSWVEGAPTLAEPWEPPVARPGRGREVPVQLAQRGVLIDTASLWRDRETIGV